MYEICVIYHFSISFESNGCAGTSARLVARGNKKRMAEPLHALPSSFLLIHKVSQCQAPDVSVHRLPVLAANPPVSMV